MERDYPIGHPAAADYAGQKYNPTRAPWQDDFAPDHPAFAGRNTGESDTPDGMREHQLAVEAERQQLGEQAVLTREPADPNAPAALPMSRDEEARAYLKSRGYSPDQVESVVKEYGLDAVLTDKAANAK